MEYQLPGDIVYWLSGEGQANDQAARNYSRGEVSPQVVESPIMFTLILSNSALDLWLDAMHAGCPGRTVYVYSTRGRVLESSKKAIPRSLRTDKDLTFCICQIQLRTTGSSYLECLWVLWDLDSSIMQLLMEP